MLLTVYIKKRSAKLFCQLVQIFVQVIEILLHLNVESAKNYLYTVRFVNKQNMLKVQKQNKWLIYVSN